MAMCAFLVGLQSPAFTQRGHSDSLHQAAVGVSAASRPDILIPLRVSPTPLRSERDGNMLDVCFDIGKELQLDCHQLSL